MPDEDVIMRINELANEEHELFGKEARGEATTKERTRLKDIQVQLDGLYDVLHQRRARRNAGLDPEDVKLPATEVLEG